MNWLELVWLGKTENTEEHQCGDELGVREFQTIKRQSEPARWRKEFVDKLTVEPFNPKPKSATVFDSGKLPFDLQWSERASPKVNIDESPKDKRSLKSAGMRPKLWLMSTVEQWAVRVARRESAYTKLNAVDGSMESCCDKAA